MYTGYDSTIVRITLSKQKTHICSWNSQLKRMVFFAPNTHKMRIMVRERLDALGLVDDAIVEIPAEILDLFYDGQSVLALECVEIKYQQQIRVDNRAKAMQEFLFTPVAATEQPELACDGCSRRICDGCESQHEPEPQPEPECDDWRECYRKYKENEK